MFKPKYEIGDKVIANGTAFQSANGTLFAGQVDKEVGKITKIAIRGAHPYKIEGIDGWFNERNIAKYEQPSVEVGDRVKLIKNQNYKKMPIKFSPNLIYILIDINKDVATIQAENNEILKIKANVYNLEKVI